MEEMRQQRVKQMVKSAEGSAGLLHKITKPTAWRGGAQILKKEEEDARLLDRCEAKREEEWAMHWQCDDSVQQVEDKPWKNEELKDVANDKRVRTGESIDIVQRKKHRSRVRRFPPRPIALMPTLIRWCEATRTPEVAKWQQKYRVDWDATDGRNGGAKRTVWEILMEMER